MLKIRDTLTEARDAPKLVPALDDLYCEVVDAPDAAWDRMAAGFSDMCLEQTVAFAGSRFGTGRAIGLILRESPNGEPLALALAVAAVIPVLGLGLAYVKFGPLWRRRGAPVQPENLTRMLEALKREFAQKRGLAVRIMPPADPGYETEWKEALAQTKFVFHGNVADPERYLVDLTLSEADQLKSLGSKWRNNLAKSAIQELEVREADLNAGMPEFLALYRGMLLRKQFDDRHGVGDLPAIAKAAGTALGMRLFLAYHARQPIVGSIIVGAGERIFVPFSATDERALELRAGYALRWAIIERLRGTEARWLDLGGTEGDQGLKHYKLGNVGKRGRIAEIPGEFEFVPGMLAAGAVRAIMLGKELAGSKKLKQLSLLLPI